MYKKFLLAFVFIFVVFGFRTNLVLAEAPSYQAPAIDILASPSPIVQWVLDGTPKVYSTIDWITSNASYCTASGGWSGSKTVPTGNLKVYPTATTTYTLTCTGPDGKTTSASATVVVSSVNNLTSGDCTSPGPTYGNYEWISTGSTTSTVNSYSGLLCKWTGGECAPNTLNDIGTFEEYLPTIPTSLSYYKETYKCSYFTLNMSATGTPMTSSDPDLLGYQLFVGDSSTITWSTTNAYSCTASGDWSGAKGLSGSQSTGVFSTPGDRTYTLTCDGPGGPITKSVSFHVVGNITVNISGSISPGGVPTITWSSTNAKKCIASGVWSGSKNTSGTFTGSALTASGTYLYTLTCSGDEVDLLNIKFTDYTITKDARIEYYPTINLTVNSAKSATVPVNSSVNLRWSSSSIASTLSSDFNTNGATSGDINQTVVQPIDGTNTVKFLIRGYNSSGDIVKTDTVTVNVTPAAVTVPTCTTPTATNITSVGATIGGNITSDGGGTITSRGVAVSTSADPTGGATVSGTTGAFSRVATGLSSGLVYHYRAWATNSAGTGYCPDASFITSEPAMSGYLSSATDSCLIASGASSCTIEFDWETYNPEKTSAITKPVNVTVATGNTGDGVPLAVKYNSETFYLYNDGQLLAQKTVSSSCVSGTAWNSTAGKCMPIVNGVCSPSNSHYSCFTGTSTNNVDGATAWTWNCAGSNTGATVSCTESKPAPTATISSNSCTIDEGKATCGVSVSWSTSNLPTGSTTAVTRNNPNVTISSATSGNSVSNTINHGTSTFYVYNSTIETALASSSSTASCVSGTAWDGSKCAPVSTPTGNISATSCTISSGGTGCISKVTWTTSNLISGGYTEVTKNNPPNTSVSGATSGTNVNNSILYGSTTFFIYHNEVELARSAPVTASCISGTAWDGSKCAPSVNGVCATTHYNCTAGTSTNEENGPIFWKWDCAGLNGGTTARDCSQTKPTATISSNSCTIDEGKATCGVSVSWSTSNLPTGSTTAVTRNNPNVTISSATSGNSVSNTINHGTSTFYVYNSTIETALASSSSTASCVSGTAWDGSKCASTLVDGACSSPATHYNCATGTSTNNVDGATAWTWNCAGSNGGTTSSCSETKSNEPEPGGNEPEPGSEPEPDPLALSGTLTPASPSCIIALGNSSCNINFSWETRNPVGVSAVTKPVNVTVATGNSGTNVPFSVKYNSETFYLYNNAVELDQSTVTSSCVSGTAWDGSKCDTIILSPNTSISANPATIVIGDSSVITWSSTRATSCSSSGNGFNVNGATSGNITVSPTVTTTYYLNCVGTGGQTPDQVTITVTTTGKKPIYIEH